VYLRPLREQTYGGFVDQLSIFFSGWDKVRQNTTSAAVDMPEEHYDSAPFDGMWSFRKQVAHVLNVADVLCDGLEQGAFDPSKFAQDNYGSRSKAELVKTLEEQFRTHQQQLAAHPASFWNEARKSFDGSDKTAGELLQMAKEHEIAHCNQIYIYLRSKGILPPTTRKRAEQKAAKAAVKV
jgi:uncharacterized damage-inducible protein DinB